jgi:hypothetical protein
MLVDVRLLAELPFGWIAFLKRVLPQITVNWNVIGMAALCMGMIFWGTHYFCSWLYVSVQKAKAADSAIRPWSWRWTGSLLVVICLPFFVGMAVIGTIHQVGWMATSTEPMYVRHFPKWEIINDMREQSIAFQIAMSDHGTNTSISYDELRTAINEVTPRSIKEKVQVLTIEDDKGNPIGLFTFVRDPNLRTNLEFLVTTESDGLLPPEKFPAMLKKYGDRMKAF